MPIKLRDHQQHALDKMFNGCVLYGGVGSGKTLTAIAYYMKVEADADVYVITTARKRDSLDWESEFVKFGVGTHLNATVAGALTVDSWNNISKYTNVRGAFFIFDEQRLVGSGEWSKSFLEIAKANNWVLLTATPGDNWLDYIPIFLAHGFYKNRTEFKRMHVVYNTYSKFPKVDRYTNVGKLVRLRNSLLVHMPYVRHTTRHLEVVEVDHDRELFKRVLEERWHVYEDRPLRDVAELFSVMRKVVNSDSSRIRTIQKLMEEHPKLIVFYNFNYELDLLRTVTEQHAKTKKLGAEVVCQSLLNDTTSEIGPSLNDAETLPLCNPPKQNGTSPSRFSTVLDPSSTEAIAAEWNVETPKTSDSKRLKNSSEETSPSIFSKKVVSESNAKCLNDGPILDLATGTSTTKGSSGSTHSTPAATKLDGIQVAEWNGHKHQEVPKGDRWVYLVQYVAGAEAWNCTDTDVEVFYSLTYSYKNFEQAMGRIDRMNTPFTKLHYKVLKSNSVIDDAVWRSLRNKESFNEGTYQRAL